MRAVAAIINHDWAMQPEYIRTMLEIAAREHPGLQAVEAERGERLEYAYDVTIRDGVAIIPIKGPIFRYSNLFTYYSGGTSVSLLARDFILALNSPLVDSILFEVNSPGGEVTGINELANMIFEARGKKPMIARAGGLCASAAYWLASAAGEIVCDETAMLGSIGVYCAYLDSKKAYQKAGFREVVIKSSQSPKKALDPSTPEGERAIQARIDSLADVFIGTVARNRDVDVETVLKDFGQGDVLVGQGAVEAGLADRLGSFEQTLAELATAHGRVDGKNYTGALDGSGPAAADRAGTPGESVAEEDPELPGDDEDDEVPDDPDDAPEDEPDEDDEEARTGDINPLSAEPPVTTEKGAMEMAEENNAGVAAGESTVAQLQAQLAEANARLTTTQQSVVALERVNRRQRFEGVASAFTGDKPAQVRMMEHLADTAGEDSELFRGYVEQQKATAEQLRQSALFGSLGTDAQAQGGDATQQLEGMVTALQAKNPALSYDEALQQVARENKGLYSQYLAEQTAPRR